MHDNGSLRVIAQEPRPAEGLDCDAGCGFAPNAPLRFKFDRWITSSTAVRQSVYLYTEGTHIGVFLRPDYDVTSRILTMRTDSPLAPDTAYLVTLPDADDDPNGFGFRGYDGSSLERSQTFVFRTATEPTVLPMSEVAQVPSCSKILAEFARAGCVTANCHGGNSPRMGLSLDSMAGLRATAIDRVAHQTQFGPELTQQVVSGGRFGVQMPIIDSGQPENSYLIYKVLIGSWLNRELDVLANPNDPFSPTGLMSSQIEDARAWFVEFGAMPPNEIGYPDGVSPLEFVTTVQSWIRAGAQCPE